MSSAGGAPVRKANVMILTLGPGESEERDFTSTDTDGRFSFTELPAGKYYLIVSHPAYVPTLRPTRDSVLTYTLSPREEVKDAVIRLVPGAVLRGRVTDEDGDPVVQSQVQLIPASKRGRYGGMVNDTFVSGNGNTNDLGEFRMFGIPPGRYYVKASPATSFGMGSPRIRKPQQSTYVPTFYPSAINTEAAGVLDLRGGDEIGINIALQRTAVYPVTGILTTANRPVENGIISVMQGRDQFGSFSVSEGKFELRLPPGRYTLIGINQDTLIQQSASGSGSAVTQVNKRIDVPSGGLRNVELAIAPSGQAVEVSGRVRTEAGASLPKQQTLFLQLQPLGAWMPNPTEDDEPYSRPNTAVGTQTKPDGTFEFKGVTPGTYELDLYSSGSGMEDWYTKAVFVAAEDVLNSGIPVANSDLELDLVLSSKGASIEGTAKDSEQHPATAATVVLIPDAARSKRQELYQTANPDQDGHFLIRGLEPGSYTAYAFEQDQAGVWFDPEEMKSYKNDGVPVSVHQGEKAHVELLIAASHQEQQKQ